MKVSPQFILGSEDWVKMQQHAGNINTRRKQPRQYQ
jgi:hypothetical protein